MRLEVLVTFVYASKRYFFTFSLIPSSRHRHPLMPISQNCHSLWLPKWHIAVYIFRTFFAYALKSCFYSYRKNPFCSHRYQWGGQELILLILLTDILAFDLVTWLSDRRFERLLSMFCKVISFPSVYILCSIHRHLLVSISQDWQLSWQLQCQLT